MARSRRKNGGPTRGRFKKKKLGKGFIANRQEPVGSRVVLRITETADAGAAKAVAAKK
ncbi:MAG: hypothetical protein JNK78_18850 [Planctomycetes bacterium]|nr:hypothetical protein [Planctomycetota bacterium]